MTDLENGGAASAGAESTTAPAPSLDDILSTSLSDAYDKATGEGGGGSGGETRSAGRDERGRFTSTRQAAETATTETGATAATATTTETTDQGQTKAAEPTHTDASTIQPPQSWSADAKTKFATLPPDIQAEIAKREGDVKKGFDQKAAESKPHIDFANTVRERLSPILGDLKRHGVDEVGGISYLVQMHQLATRDPEGYIRTAAKTLGVDLGKLTGTAQQGQTTDGTTTAEYVDPQIANLHKTVQTLEQKLSAREQAEADQQTKNANSQIEAFKADPAHPHFDAVRQDMAILIQTGRATDLKDAYDKAVWMNPDLRAQTLETQRKADEEKRRKEAAEEAERARKAAGTRLSSKGASASVRTGGPRSMEDTMSEAYDRATGKA
jgi:hypothetical protein